MSNTLIEKIRKARESSVELSGFVFKFRRPTDEEAVTLGRMTFIDVCRHFVTGWEKVKELDVIPGGGPEPVPFDAELWGEWLADRPDFWQPLQKAILDSYRAHSKKRDAEAKN